MTQEELMVEARLSVPTTELYLHSSLMTMMKSHEKMIANKMNLIHVIQLENGKFKTRYELPALEITRRVKEMYKEYLVHPPNTKS